MADMPDDVRRRGLDSLRALLVDITRRINQAERQAEGLVGYSVARDLGAAASQVDEVIGHVDLELKVVSNDG